MKARVREPRYCVGAGNGNEAITYWLEVLPLAAPSHLPIRQLVISMGTTGTARPADCPLSTRSSLPPKLSNSPPRFELQVSHLARGKKKKKKKVLALNYFQFDLVTTRIRQRKLKHDFTDSRYSSRVTNFWIIIEFKLILFLTVVVRTLERRYANRIPQKETFEKINQSSMNYFVSNVDY